MSVAAEHSSSRRALLRGRLRAASLPRPPWALTEAEFIDQCTRCGDCLRVCPERVLSAGDGGFPVFDPETGGCSFCGACVEACTVGALDAALGARSVWHAAVGETCLGRAGIVCQSCRDACAEHAITFPLAALAGRGPAIPTLDVERCTGCGACVGVCPAAAIELRPTSGAAA